MAAENKLYPILRLCRKAGKIVLGSERVMERALSGEVSLILLSRDLSPRSVRRMTEFAQKADIPLIQTELSMDEIEFILAKRSGIAGITDKGFSEKIKSTAIQEEHNDK